nr:MAG TPA: hypothetical protein [Bacteriophage sp.]
MSKSLSVCGKYKAEQGRAQQLEPAFAFCHRTEQQGREVIDSILI